MTHLFLLAVLVHNHLHCVTPQHCYYAKQTLHLTWLGMQYVTLLKQNPNFHSSHSESLSVSMMASATPVPIAEHLGIVGRAPVSVYSVNQGNYYADLLTDCRSLKPNLSPYACLPIARKDHDTPDLQDLERPQSSPCYFFVQCFPQFFSFFTLPLFFLRTHPPPTSASLKAEI